VSQDHTKIEFESAVGESKKRPGISGESAETPVRVRKASRVNFVD
jgi:hypothetical protein